ncbi:MAG: hypothetical protein K2N32_03480, partial [Clostridia bacterium]|nr:hypothetical protein [Clostridia bacterium]
MEKFNPEELPTEVIFGESQSNPKVKVEHKDGWVEYYKNDKPVFKLFDNDYFAFTKDNAARRLLNSGDALGAIAQLDAIKFRHIKSSTLLLCHQTYVHAFLELKEYLNAYSRCKAFMEKNLYIDAMLVLLEGLYKSGYVSQFKELREYIASRGGYEIYQLERFFDYTDESGDYEFWEKLVKNNPLENLRETDERLCLEGRAYERKGNFELAEKSWRKATSLYGQFSGAKYYLTYPEIFEKAKTAQAEVLPTLSNAAELSLPELCKDVVVKQLQDYKTDAGKYVDADKTARTLNIALTKLFIELRSLSESVGELYSTGYLPFVSEIDRLAVSDEVDDFNRAICLANFTLYHYKKEIIWKGEKIRNIVDDLKCGDFNVRYGIAMFAAHAIICLRAESKELAKVHSEIKKFHSMIEWEKYPQIKPYAVYVFLLEYYANLRPLPQRVPYYAEDLKTLISVMNENVGVAENQKYSQLYEKMLARMNMIDKRINENK